MTHTLILLRHGESDWNAKNLFTGWVDVGLTEKGNTWVSRLSGGQRQRLAIAYHYLGGLPHTETAAIIGSSPDAVRRAASDGIRRLRQTYHDGEHTEGAPR